MGNVDHTKLYNSILMLFLVGCLDYVAWYWICGLALVCDIIKEVDVYWQVYEI
jgi:hypothetical protein